MVKKASKKVLKLVSIYKLNNDGTKSYSIDIWEEARYNELGYVRGRLGNVV